MTLQHFDYSAAFPEGYAESQKGEGGGNWFDNCVPTSGLELLRAIGLGQHVTPENITDFEYGANYTGPESFVSFIDWVKKHVPNPPNFRIINPANTLEAICNAAAAKLATVCQFWCDHAANLVPYHSGIFHVSPVIKYDGRVTVQNVWEDKRPVYGEADFAKFVDGAAGWLLIAERNVVLSQPAPPKPAPPAPVPPGVIQWQHSTHRVKTQWQTVRVRASYSFGAATLRLLKGGTSIDCDGFLQNNTGRWYHLSPKSGYGWVSAAVLD